ncbi:MAG: pyridoxal-phosphate dependent enzyme [Woeseiaceae bacterium]|nr:pyridoxal-phosphate dependent enzyme [Woeseiaceae bacterium]
MSNCLAAAYPLLAERLQKTVLAELPTPVSTAHFESTAGLRTISIKHDDVSSAHYGGNKVRKLEYILQRARERGARRIATFGSAGSNHALATAMLATASGYECTCLLSHQPRTANIARTLNMHRLIGTELVPYGGRVDPLATFRRYLQGRCCWVIPLGGSSWLGAVGFVNAGLELAAQVAAGQLTAPARIYIANGTMGSSVGLALGLALADMPTVLHAVRVVDDRFASIARFERLLQKTAMMLRRLDPSIPDNIAERTRLCWRDEFFAGGYALADDTTKAAVRLANGQMGLQLETTYTGKAMSALLHDMAAPDYAGEHFLFWNTYNSRPLPVTTERPPSPGNIPIDFMRYFE